jgi:biotin transport system substrate-specific component
MVRYWRIAIAELTETKSPSPCKRTDRLASEALIALFAAIVITLSAKFQIPFWPVPMTLHTLAVFLTAALLGPRIGVAAMVLYLGAGAMGWPVFANSPERGIGLAYMVGPTGGYLLGYLAASAIVGYLAAGWGLIRRLLVMLIALGVVYALGVAWLARFVPNDALLASGVTPFLLGDILKVVAAALMTTGLRRLAGGRR